MLASLGEHKSQHFENRIDRVQVSPHACALQQESNTSSILEPKWLQWQIFLHKSMSAFEKYITTILIIVYAESWTHALTFTPSWRRFKRLTSWSKSSLNRSWCRAMIQSHEHPNKIQEELLTPSPLLRSLCPLPPPLLLLTHEQEKTRKEMKEHISQLLLASE